jgi:hypothetical protein
VRAARREIKEKIGCPILNREKKEKDKEKKARGRGKLRPRDNAISINR